MEKHNSLIKDEKSTVLQLMKISVHILFSCPVELLYYQKGVVCFNTERDNWWSEGMQDTTVEKASALASHKSRYLKISKSLSGSDKSVVDGSCSFFSPCLRGFCLGGWRDVELGQQGRAATQGGEKQDHL